jgi:putative oxidoreductase
MHMQQAVAKRYYVPALGSIYEKLDWLAWPIVRIAAGALLIPHGAAKLFGIGASVSGTAQGMAKLGLEPAYPLALYIACLEFFGGILLTIGFLTRPIALLVAGFMAVAAFYVHMPNGFFWTKGGYEYPLMWLLLAVALMIRGGGELSVDRALRREV